MFVRNKLLVICVLFTILTLAASTLDLVQGQAHSGNTHILVRFMIVALAIGSLYIFDWLNRSPYYLAHLTHYGVTMATVFLLLWAWGLRAELHPDAYRDIFLNYTIIYAGVTLAELFYFRLRKRDSHKEA